MASVPTTTAAPKVAPTNIVMDDGSTVAFSPKDKVRKMSDFNEAGDTLIVKFAFRNGVMKTCEVPVSSPVVLQAALHGFDQKFGDAFAGLTSVDDCAMTFDKLSKTILAGEWTQKRVGDGMAGTSELARAIAKVKSLGIDAVIAKLATMDKDQKAALRGQADIAAAILEIKAAKVKPEAAIDATKLLSAFDDVEPAAHDGNETADVATA